MKEVEIVKIKPTSMAFIVSAFYFFAGLITALISLIISFGTSTYYDTVSIIRTTLYPLILFPIVGFIAGILFSFVYNFIAKRTAGIRLVIKN